MWINSLWIRTSRKRRNDFLQSPSPANSWRTENKPQAQIFWGVLIIGSFLAASSAFPESLSIFPVADTSPFEYTPTINLGAETLVSGTICLGYRSRALIRFSNGDIPRNVILVAASLKLTVEKISSNGGQTVAFDLHRMLRPWGEGK